MADEEDPCLVLLPEEQVIGLSFTVLAGFISSFAVIFVLLLVARNYMRNVRHPPPGGEWKLIRTHVDAYLLSLLASDFLQGLGAILNVKWAAERQVYCSATCTTQGIIQVVGESGVAMATFAIALHTFLVIFFRWSPSPGSSWIWKVGISFIWLYVSTYAIAGYAAHNKPTNDADTVDSFYTPTPYWCWISKEFNAERITAEYLWLWFAAFSSIVLYTFLFFRVRGNITVDPLDWRRVRFKWRRYQSGDGEGEAYFDGPGPGARGGEAGKDAAREAMSMIWYPLTYTVLVLPLSIVRWSTFRPIGEVEPDVPFAVTSIVITIFGLSGIVNVVLILLTRKNLLLFGQRGVINPAKIGPAATGRLPPQNNNDGGGPGGAGAQKKGRFYFRDGVLGHDKNAGGGGGGKREMAEDSTGETTDDHRRHRDGQGDTSFAAGRFTTQAYATERSFDVGSNRAPFSPVTGPTDTNNTESMPAGIPMDEEQSYGYGYGYGPGLGSDNGIPEGQSRDLGDRGEYGRSFGSVQQPSTAAATAGTIPIAVGMLGVGDTGGRGQTVSSGQETRADVSRHSNFLEMKDSRSNPGQPENPSPSNTGAAGADADYPQYPPSSHPHPNLPHPYSYSHPHNPYPPTHPLPQQQHAEGRRGSAGTTGKNAGGSRPNSAKSKTGSSLHNHPSRPSGEMAMADYSVPMKFNPTPAPTPSSHPPGHPYPPPGLTTSNPHHHLHPSDAAADSSRLPYASKSRNGSSKSLGKSTSTQAGASATTSSKSPWSGFTSMFSNRNSYGVSPPNSAKSDSSLVPNTQHQHQRQHQETSARQQQQQQPPPPQLHPYSQPSHPYSQPQSHPYNQQPHPYNPQQQGVGQIRPLHFSRDFGPQLRSSLSLRTPEAELERSPFDDQARVERSPSHEALALARTRTGNSSHEGVGGGGAGGNLHAGSWSRASAGGRRGTQGTQGDEEAYSFRPNTAGSNRSYTFGPPGFNTGGASGGGGSSSSLRVDAAPVPAPVSGADVEHGLEMQERPRMVHTHPPRSPLDSQNIGRAL